MSKTDPSKLVLEFLSKHNRPYAVNDVLEQCGKELGKATVQKILDMLVDKEKVTAKAFGKQKIYFIKQSGDVQQYKKELQIYAQKLTQSQNSLQRKQTEHRELETKLKTLSNVRSLESLEQERGQLLDEIRVLNEKLRRYEAKAAEAKLTPAAARSIEKRYENVAIAYRKRKRICVDMLDAILEGYPKPKKALIEDIGVETDEAAEFKVIVKQKESPYT